MKRYDKYLLLIQKPTIKDHFQLKYTKKSSIQRLPLGSKLLGKTLGLPRITKYNVTEKG